MDWREIKNDREKYAAYLCSREWSEKREAVRARAGGKCERCFVNPMTAVHHLTYARKYNESMDDLQAICDECHQFTHGKSDENPQVPSLPLLALKHSSESSLLLCPVCGCLDVHVGEVQQPEHAHDRIVILEVWGECGHEFDLRFHTHKGSTECFIERMRRVRDG